MGLRASQSRDLLTEEIGAGLFVQDGAVIGFGLTDLMATGLRARAITIEAVDRTRSGTLRSPWFRTSAARGPPS
jgi:hypothetical protein